MCVIWNLIIAYGPLMMMSASGAMKTHSSMATVLARILSEQVHLLVLLCRTLELRKFSIIVPEFCKCIPFTIIGHVAAWYNLIPQLWWLSNLPYMESMLQIQRCGILLYTLISTPQQDSYRPMKWLRAYHNARTLLFLVILSTLHPNPTATTAGGDPIT